MEAIYSDKTANVRDRAIPSNAAKVMYVAQPGMAKLGMDMLSGEQNKD